MTLRKLFIVSTMAVLLISMMTITVSAQETKRDGFLTNSQGVDPYDEFKRQLNAMLRTTRDEERKFISDVVDSVEAGELSLKLVQSSYGWVRNKRPTTKYPFIYFERVLRLLAKKTGQEDAVPEFDSSIYRTRQPRFTNFFQKFRSKFIR